MVVSRRVHSVVAQSIHFVRVLLERLREDWIIGATISVEKVERPGDDMIEVEMSSEVRSGVEFQSVERSGVEMKET